MSENAFSPQEVRGMASAIGWNNLSDAQLQELTRATNIANARRGQLPSEILTPADEPAHVYRLEPGNDA